ncbi:long-chain fatty alcohol dehydrogenase [Patellaria atrata CBS 101060]|uniref:Long-chain fatty alcohol dehydrogenase n=1 Tax=Patellaria atrata CBS 101060 TaxID=1346257 RepID=A0A9P4SIG0_9PEZI|nr:long-chain fatty alcohol dehydrogenase [Patellaria atrata CBS 101060]
MSSISGTAMVPPTAIPRPPLPDVDPLTPEQWRTILAIADSVIPSIKPAASSHEASTNLPVPDSEYSTALSTIQGSSSAREELARHYLEECPSTSQDFKNALTVLFSRTLPEQGRKTLLVILDLLNNRVSSLLLTGYATPIAEQPVNVRHEIIKAWGIGRLGPLRLIQRSLTMLFRNLWLKNSPTVDRVLSYPRTPENGKRNDSFPYEFLQFSAGDSPVTLDTDVVIVGSGCGGAVAAKNLAEAGHRVVLVEKAYHWTSAHFPMNPDDAAQHLYMNNQLMASDDQSISVFAGQTWGGGGTINWSASLQTQGFVRKEWADEGLTFFTSAEFQNSLDRVCDRMGVSTDNIQHNPANRVLLEGGRKLGYAVKPVPLNTGGKQHSCGYCSTGCPSCEKQGPVVSWLPDAARAGAEFIEGFDAQNVVFDTIGGKKMATGVRGVWRSRDKGKGVNGSGVISREVFINAKRVIVSAGTLQSPLLLLRSGLTNPQIGRNLKLHPVSLMGGIHKEETKPWEGSIITAVVHEFDNLDGAGHGVKIETSVGQPASFLVFFPWKGGLDFKVFASRLKHMTSIFSMARDIGSGYVYPEPSTGQVKISYTVSPQDKKHILEGLIACAKIQYVAGAQEIFTAIPGVSRFIREKSNTNDDHEGINNPKFQEWLAEIRRAGFPAPETPFTSAHQMGTCRMGVSPRNSVVDPKGQVWGTESLFVADASVFPSASGVNPMITNMAISDWISKGIAKGLKKEEGFESARL